MDTVEWELDTGDIPGPLVLEFRVVGGEPVFNGGSLGREDFEPRQVVHLLWNVVRGAGWTYEAHFDAVLAWIERRGWDAIEEREAAAKETRECIAYHEAADAA